MGYIGLILRESIMFHGEKERIITLIMKIFVMSVNIFIL